MANANEKNNSKKPVAKKPTGTGNRNFFKGMVSELKKVHWPTKQNVAKYTVVVLASVVVMSAVLWAVDTVLSLGLSAIIK